MQIVLNLERKDILSYLRGIEALGRKIDGSSIDFSVSGLGCALLLQYFRIYCNDQVMRGAYALFWALHQDHDRILEPLARLIGCGKDTLKRGIEEIGELGFVFDKEHPNAPGAGRPTAEADFRELYKAVCIVAGFTPDDIKARIAQCRASATSADIQKSVTDAHAPDNQSAEGSDDGVIAAPAERVDIVEQISKVQEVSGPVLERLADECRRAKTGHILEFKQLSEVLQNYKAWLVAVGKNYQLRYPETDTPSDEEKPEDPARVVADMFRGAYEGIIVLASDKLLSICDNIAAVFKEFDGCSSYQIMKELGRNKNLMNAGKDLSAHRLDYDQLQESIHELIQVAENARATLPEAGFGTEKGQLPVFDLDGSLAGLDQLIGKLETDLGGALAENRQTRKVRDALKKLNEIKEFLLAPVAQELLDDAEFRCSLAILAETVRVKAENWLKAWEASHTPHFLSVKVASEILTLWNQKVFKALLDSCEGAKDAHDASKAHGEEKGEAPSHVGEEAVSEIRSSVKAIYDDLAFLQDRLEKGEKNRRTGKNAKKSNIPEAQKFLKEISEKLSSMEKTAEEVNSPSVWKKLLTTAGILHRIISQWMGKAKKDSEGGKVTYTEMKQVAQKILAGKNKKALAELSSSFCSTAAKAGAENSDLPGDDFSENWFTSLTPDNGDTEI